MAIKTLIKFKTLHWKVTVRIFKIFNIIFLGPPIIKRIRLMMPNPRLGKEYSLTHDSSLPTPSSIQFVSNLNESIHQNSNANNQQVMSSNIEILSRQFSSIMSNYVPSRKTVDKLFRLIQSIPLNGHIYLSDFLNNIAYVSRPNEESRMQMLEELQESGIIRYSAVKRNSFKIKKGPQFL
jgi:hypothetical protein